MKARPNVTPLEAHELAKRLILALQACMDAYCAGDKWDETTIEILTDEATEFLIVHLGDDDSG